MHHSAARPCPTCPMCRRGAPCPWYARALARHQAMRAPRPMRRADEAARALALALVAGPAIGAALVPYQAMALAWWHVHPAPPALAALVALVAR